LDFIGLAEEKGQHARVVLKVRAGVVPVGGWMDEWTGWVGEWVDVWEIGSCLPACVRVSVAPPRRFPSTTTHTHPTRPNKTNHTYASNNDKPPQPHHTTTTTTTTTTPQQQQPHHTTTTTNTTTTHHHQQVPAITIESSALRASKALLRRVSALTLHSGLMDSNLYLLSHWVLELIEHKEDFTR
jgi:hypothetical protein